MKFAIISDVHANLEALQAVLADARSAADRVICLGDIVGYNANPMECLQLVQAACEVVVAGNHDQAAAGLRLYDDFNEYASAAIDWTKERLTTDAQAYLRMLPTTATFGAMCLAAHGSPRDTDEYLFQGSHFRQSFAYLQQYHPTIRCCFVGHTHLPMVWQWTPDGQARALEAWMSPVTLDPACRYIINPGSVGQPRYGGPDATYALFDEATYTLTLRLIPYDVDTTQEKIYDAGLPPYLAERLASGF